MNEDMNKRVEEIRIDYGFNEEDMMAEARISHGIGHRKKMTAEYEAASADVEHLISEIDRLKEESGERQLRIAELESSKEGWILEKDNLEAENKELKEEKKESIFKLAEIKELERHVKQYAVDNVLTKNEIFEMKSKLKQAEEGLEDTITKLSTDNPYYFTIKGHIDEILKSIRGEKEKVGK